MVWLHLFCALFRIGEWHSHGFLDLYVKIISRGPYIRFALSDYYGFLEQDDIYYGMKGILNGCKEWYQAQYLLFTVRRRYLGILSV